MSNMVLQSQQRMKNDCGFAEPEPPEQGGVLLRLVKCRADYTINYT
jgi:hypothetical protein